MRVAVRMHRCVLEGPVCLGGDGVERSEGGMEVGVVMYAGHRLLLYVVWCRFWAEKLFNFDEG